ncbi:Bud site selection protein RAX1 [Spathaspora sp. JA1]|nr:Bud site selection protein RAX1 [Spathaspora sp. JA1]
MSNNIYDEKYQSNFPNSHYLANLNNLNATNQTIHLNRLPTLGEILANKSKSPVDLLTFYQFMKEIEGQVDYLDFWFDLINHLNLCKHYVKGLRDSIVRQSQIYAPKDREISGSTRYTGVTAPSGGIRDSIAASETSKRKSLSSSILLELIINDNILEENDSPRLSAFLRGDINLDNTDPKLNELIELYNSQEPTQAPQAPQQASPMLLSSSQKSSPSFLAQNQQFARTSPYDGEDDAFSEHFYDIRQADKAVSPTHYIMQQRASSGEQPPVVSPFDEHQIQSSRPKLAQITPTLLERLLKDVPTDGNTFITRDRLRESSHNLLLKYFMGDSEKNLNLPERLNASIIKAIEVEERDDPDVFNYVKNYVFNKIENEHLPKFLDCMATRNINHSEFWRIIFGFFFIFIGFWISYIFIFLNYRKSLRPVIIAPYLVGFYLIVSSIYLVDPVLAWFGFSEGFSKTQRRLIKIREKFIYNFILKRSYWVLFLILIATAILSVIFSLVPGHRL